VRILLQEMIGRVYEEELDEREHPGLRSAWGRMPRLLYLVSEFYWDPAKMMYSHLWNVFALWRREKLKN